MVSCLFVPLKEDVRAGTARRLLPVVVVDVVPAAVAQKCTAGALKRLDESPPLHAISSSSSLRIPGMSSVLKV